MKHAVVRSDSAMELPDEWDKLCRSPYQQRSFLAHCEAYNPCRQRYYLLENGATLLAGAVVYTHRQDLLTFLSIPSPVRLRIIGIPCSVSSGGIIGDTLHTSSLCSGITRIEKRGLHLLLNASVPTVPAGWSNGSTLPTIVFNNRFKCWDSYLSSLKSHYRRRIRKITEHLSHFTIKQLPCASFSERHYSLYKDVYHKSTAKLEKLSHAFFSHLPDTFDLTVLHFREKTCGWYITTTFKSTLSYFLGGMDYTVNNTFNLYFGMLQQIIRGGIEQGFSSIDLGQTAETAKARFGGTIESRYMAGHHSNPLFNMLLKNAAPFLSYRGTASQPDTFRRNV
jgi:hypothetical protein